MKHKAVLLVLFLTCSVCAVAQHTLQGTVRSEDNKFLEGAVIQLQRDTTLIGVSMTERKGEYRFDNIEKGDYLLYVSAFGHQPIRERLNIISNVQKDFNMTVEGEALLDEVTITADMSQVIIPNATGAVYYLSNHAKGLNNPYEALQEIDRLIIIPTEKKVMLTDGSSLLILINGKRFGGGIDSIDPSLVEEVELIESPSARYVKDGIRSILNIKMRRRAASYYNANLTARHMLPLMYGITMPYFETGNSRLSFNVSAQHFYFHNDDSTWEGWQRNAGYYKDCSGDKRYNMQNFYGEANLDWLISDKDNFVINASIIVSPSKTSTSGTGSLTDNGSFSLWGQDKGNYYVNSYNLYYRHVFTKSSFLEATGHFNFNGNSTKGHRIEEYNDWTYDDLYDFDNYRYSGGA